MKEPSLDIAQLPDRMLFRVMGKPCGALTGNAYLKTVHTRNKFKKTNSWGISDIIIDYLKIYQERHGVVGIILTDQKKKKYEITLDEALEVGQYFQFKEFEKQLFIPIKDFSK